MNKSRIDWDRAQYGSDTALCDTVLICALGFILLFLAAWLLIRPPAVDGSVKLKAEFVLTMTWPDGALDDIDLWIMLPDGRKVHFRHKDVDFATLERDDLGAMNDFYYDGSGQRQLMQSNREMATIRAIVPGRYVLAAHVYADHPTFVDQVDGGKTWSGAPALPYAAQLEIVKLNPRVSTVLSSVVQLTERGQEAVFAAFDIDADGAITNIELNPSQYKIVELIPLFQGSGEEALR